MTSDTSRGRASKVADQLFWTLVRNCMQASFSSAVRRQWLTSFDALFGEKTVLPLHTSCCWYPLRCSNHWTHHSYFMVLDVMMAYDFSRFCLEHLNTSLPLMVLQMKGTALVSHSLAL
jgi:hypothetical protein